MGPQLRTRLVVLTVTGENFWIYFVHNYQQYLDKFPNGYCNHGFNGVSCPIGLNVPAQVEVLPPK